MKFKFERHVCNVSLHSTGSPRVQSRKYSGTLLFQPIAIILICSAVSPSLLSRYIERPRIAVQDKCLHSGLVSVVRAQNCCTHELSHGMCILEKVFIDCPKQPYSRLRRLLTSWITRDRSSVLTRSNIHTCVYIYICIYICDIYDVYTYTHVYMYIHIASRNT